MMYIMSKLQLSTCPHHIFKYIRGIVLIEDRRWDRGGGGGGGGNMEDFHYFSAYLEGEKSKCLQPPFPLVHLWNDFPLLEKHINLIGVGYLMNFNKKMMFIRCNNSK